MTKLAVSRRLFAIVVAGALFLSPILVVHMAAALSSVKDSDNCTKVNATSRSSSGVNLTCTRVGTTKVLKWKRTMTKPDTSTTVPAVSTSSQISIINLAFTVSSKVKSTDVLSVTNRDGFTHTVTAENGDFDVTVAGGSKASLPTLSPGTYSFHCSIHSFMRGTLTVG